MLTGEMIATTEKHRLGYVATVSADGSPNVSPKGTFVVIDDNTLAFGEIRSPKTLKNLQTNSSVEVNFVDPLTRKGFRAKGKAAVHDRESDVYERHIALFDRWGELARRINNIVFISVEVARPLSSPAYDDGATEAELRAAWTDVLLEN